MYRKKVLTLNLKSKILDPQILRTGVAKPTCPKSLHFNTKKFLNSYINIESKLKLMSDGDKQWFRLILCQHTQRKVKA